MSKQIDASKISGKLSREAIVRIKKNISILAENKNAICEEQDSSKAFKVIKKDYDLRVKDLNSEAQLVGVKIANAFDFFEKAFGDGQELLIVVTEMTSNFYFSRFIGQYGCEAYFRHNKDLLFYERQRDIERTLKELNLDDIE